jgi:hypothetical protein
VVVGEVLLPRPNSTRIDRALPSAVQPGVHAVGHHPRTCSAKVNFDRYYRSLIKSGGVRPFGRRIWRHCCAGTTRPHIWA